VFAESSSLAWFYEETFRWGLKGRAAQALVHWIDMGGIDDGPLFRPISKAGRVLNRRLSPDAIAQIIRHRLTLAGLPQDFASPHGLRSGFLTQAALDGAPIQAAMRLSLHRSLAQAQKYYDDVDIAENPAADLLG
jgi:integrase